MIDNLSFLVKCLTSRSGTMPQGHGPWSVIFVFIIFILFFSWGTPRAARKVKCREDNDACIAYKHYVDGLNFLSASKISEAESSFEKARKLLGEDTEKLTLYEECYIREDASFRPRLKKVWCPRKKKYFPNESLKNLRAQNPPLPIIVFKVDTSEDEKKLTLGIHNIGGYKMEDVKVKLSGSFLPDVYIGTILPGKVKSGRSIELLPGIKKVQVKINERYGFTVRKFTIHVQ